MVTTRTQRSNVWFVVMFVLMIVGGFLVIGYWQSYDIKCAGARVWDWKQFPPQYVCALY